MTTSGSGAAAFGMIESYLTTQNLYGMLCTSAYVFDKNDHVVRSDVTNEITSPNYDLGGVPLDGQLTWQNPDLNIIYLVAEQLDFGLITAPDISNLVVYINTDEDDLTDDTIVGVYTFPTESRVNQQFIFTFAEEDTNPFGRGIVVQLPY